MFTIQPEQIANYIVSTSNEGVWIVDASMTIIFASDSLAKMLGYVSAEIAGLNLDEFVFDEDRADFLQKIERRKKGIKEEFDFRYRRKNGSPLWARVSTNPLFDEKGEFAGACSLLTDISKYREYEKRLEESEERYRAFIEQSSEGIWRCEIDEPIDTNLSADEQITLIYANAFLAECNDAMAKQYGFDTSADLEGVRLGELFAVEDPKNYYFLKAFIESGYRITEAESHEKDKFGKDRYFLNNFIGIVENGRLARAWGMQRDVTERKVADQTKAHLAAIIETSDDAIISKNLDGIIQSWNKSAEKMFGYTAEEITGKSIKTIIPEHLLNEEKEIIGRIKSGEKIRHYETVRHRKNGELIDVSLAISPIKGDGDKIIGVSKIVRDITERKRAAEALITAELRAAKDYQNLLSRIVPLAQTFGAARDLTTIYRAVRDFVRNSMPCSAFFVSFFDERSRLRTAGYAWGNHEELDISQFPPLELTENGGPNSQAVFQKKSVVVGGYMNLMKDRAHIVIEDDGQDPMSSLVVPMLVMNRAVGTLEVQAYEDDAFNQEHIVALEMAANLAAVAIENVRLLQLEAEARETAEAANRAKDEFLSVLSHELRTPLNSMLGWIKMMRTGMLDEERSRQAVEVIERNMRLQNNLIEDLLDVSRIISGKMLLDLEEVEMVSVVRDVFETLRPAAESKNIEYVLTAGESVIIDGDATRLHQIFANLIQNAIKFTPEGGKIDVVLENFADSVKLSVKDTGVGIVPEFLPFIFERFRQADTSTRRNFSGLGLGLTIVSKLIGLHGGNITAESAGKNTGAIFTAEFPVAERHRNRNLSGNKTPENNSNLKGAKILLVDDDADSIVPLQMLLEREKAEVVTVFSANDALSKLKDHKFHILISDIGMPDMDGYELIARVRQLTAEQNAFLPAIALTAYASIDDRRRALSAGFQTHFSKPFDFDKLLEAIITIYKDLK